MDATVWSEGLAWIYALNDHDPVGYAEDRDIEQFHRALTKLEESSGYDLSGYRVQPSDYEKVLLSWSPPRIRRPDRVTYADDDRVRWRTLKTKIIALLTFLNMQSPAKPGMGFIP